MSELYEVTDSGYSNVYSAMASSPSVSFTTDKMDMLDPAFSGDMGATRNKGHGH